MSHLDRHRGQALVVFRGGTDEMTDSKTTEVLIIGAGAAGLSAAVAARDSGAKVTVIEKGAKLGGTPACRKRALQTVARTHSRISGRWIMAK
jgi:succinate dehydrogenase/fumarate reductase flavoprotein subunit